MQTLFKGQDDESSFQLSHYPVEKQRRAFFNSSVFLKERTNFKNLELCKGRLYSKEYNTEEMRRGLYCYRRIPPPGHLSCKAKAEKGFPFIGRNKQSRKNQRMDIGGGMVKGVVISL